MATTPTARKRGRVNDGRGNNADRKRRKLNMLRHHGDGATCPCAWCGDVLTFDTIEADRIEAGYNGGRYVMTNVVPACRHCNASRQETPADEYAARCADPERARAMIAHAATYRPQR